MNYLFDSDNFKNYKLMLIIDCYKLVILLQFVCNQALYIIRVFKHIMLAP